MTLRATEETSEPPATGRPDGAAGDRARRPLRLASVDWTTYGLLLGLVTIGIVFAIGTDGLFLSGRNLTLLLVQAVILGISTAGIVFIMVAGHIDLSVGSAVGLVATVVAWTQSQQHFGTFASVGTAILVGLLIGGWQGLWVAYLKVPAFIVTLAGMMLIRGMTYILAEGQTYAVQSQGIMSLATGQLSKALSLALVVVTAVLALLPDDEASEDAQGPLRGWIRLVVRRVPVLVLLGLIVYLAMSYRGIPYAVLIVAALASILTFVGNSTLYGRRIYAIGGDVESARRAGINVKRYVFVLFALMGLVYALDGIMLSARLGGAPPDPALFLELNAITAAIIGGTSLFGGVGRVAGALLGAVLLTSLSNGMQLMNISTSYQYVVEGVVLLFAVLVDITLKEKRRGA
jgi:D-xylose transport system permease protein